MYCWYSAYVLPDVAAIHELPTSLNRIVGWMDLKLVVGDRLVPERVTVT